MKIRQMGDELFIQTDRHDEAKSRFSQFCERAWKSVKCSVSTTTLTTLPHTVSCCSQV